jgi:hypothetical protein
LFTKMAKERRKAKKPVAFSINIAKLPELESA